ncbi:MAG: RNA polymerase II, partial [Lysinibacillus sp.]
MKFAVTIFTMLLAVVGGLVFVQFQVYSNQNPVAKHEYTYSQEIEVEHRGDSLDIRHHFKNLPKQELVIDWPANAVDAQCFLETESACKRLNEQMTKLVAGENNSQSISYVIPLKDGLQSGKLLKDIFVQLENGSVKFSTVHITTEPKVAGSWVTGLPLIGYQKLSLVNYAMFTGEGTVKDLYWQKANFSFLTSKDVYSLYSNTGVSKKEQQELTKLKAISDDHISIVKVKKKPKQQGYRILFVDDTNTKAIQRSLTMQQLEQMYTFEKSPNWLKQLVGSVVIDKKIGYRKSQQILDEIRTELSEEQFAALKENVIALEGKTITPKVIDEQLSNAVGAYTKYISLNV